MMSIDRVVLALQTSTISVEEKEVWTKILPHLTREELEELVLSFEKETEDLASLRASFLGRARKLIDQSTASLKKQGLEA